MVKFKSFTEFKNDYEAEGFIDKMCSRYYPLKKLNPKQLSRYYLQYVKKWDKAHGDNILEKSEDVSEDSKLSAFARKRDNGCRLLKVLTEEELAEWQVNNNGIGLILDAAHVFGKNAFPWMRFDENNVVTINRFSHNCLDMSKSPINGKSITDAQRVAWWQRIAGSDWKYLEMRTKERN